MTRATKPFADPCVTVHRSLCAAILLTTTSCSSESPDLPRLDAEAVRLGQQVYRQECARCHGAAGEGTPGWKSPGADGQFPPPPHDSSGHTWHHADGLLYRIIEMGGDGSAAPTPASAPSGMPAFGDRLSPQQIRAVITYLKTWWQPGQREFQAEVSAEDPMPATPE